MAKKFDWYPWEAARWLTDERVRMMTFAERGLYRDCLDYQFINGSIPADLKRLAAVMGASLSEIEPLFAGIADMFETSEEARLVNPRMVAILEEQQAKRERYANAGAAGGKARSDKGSSDAEASPEQGGSDAKATPKKRSSNKNKKRYRDPNGSMSDAPQAAVAPPPFPLALGNGLLPDDLNALKRVALDFLAAFGNATSTEAKATHGTAYTNALATFRSRGATLPETWAAFTDAWMAQNGKPLFGPQAKTALSFLKHKSRAVSERQRERATFERQGRDRVWPHVNGDPDCKCPKCTAARASA